MAITSDSDDDGEDDVFYDTGSGWSDETPPMEHLLEFVAPGSRLEYDYFPMAFIGGATGWLKLIPTVGVVRYENHHEYITGMYFACGGRCFLDYGELVALLKFFEVWLIPTDCRPEANAARVQTIRYETRNGFVIRWTSPTRQLPSRIHLEVHGTFTLTLDELQQLFKACSKIKSFLDKFQM